MTALYRVNKGTPIFLPILAINRLKKLWGEDAFEFRYVYSPTRLRLG